MAEPTLEEKIADARAVLAKLLAEKKRRDEAKWKKELAGHPFPVGSKVTTARSPRNYTVERITPRAVIINFWNERIPLKRVLPADPSKPEYSPIVQHGW